MSRDNPPPRQPDQALQPATRGAGPLLQRDYWAVIADCRYTPSALMAFVADRFSELAPPHLVIFERCGEGSEPLAVGDEFDIRIRLAGTCRVRVLHHDACSFTFGTLEGHPEAGRITFGAYRNDRGDVIFHIRSRARSSSPAAYLGFRSAGDPMQTETWTDFVDQVAHTCGSGVVGFVHADTRQVEDEDLDEGDEAMDRPTYTARGD